MTFQMRLTGFKRNIISRCYIIFDSIDKIRFLWFDYILTHFLLSCFRAGSFQYRYTEKMTLDPILVCAVTMSEQWHRICTIRGKIKDQHRSYDLSL